MFSHIFYCLVVQQSFNGPQSVNIIFPLICCGSYFSISYSFKKWLCVNLWYYVPTSVVLYLWRNSKVPFEFYGNCKQKLRESETSSVLPWCYGDPSTKQAKRLKQATTKVMYTFVDHTWPHIYHLCIFWRFYLKQWLQLYAQCSHAGWPNFLV